MQIQHLTKQIQSTRQELIDHPAFGWVNTLEKAQVFMETHVWAVWDFMVLLKALQRELTCVNTYWVPKGDPEIRRLINEIVHGEESDVDQDGVATSHFELYVRAMEEAGADTAPILSFIEALKTGQLPFEALDESGAPEGAKAFVRQTLEVVEGGNAHEIAAVFTFGREDLIPDMFMEIVGNLKKQFPDELGLFAYYLERHIEVDGDLHGHLAERMVELLCGESEAKWQSAAELSEKALRARIDLWTAVMQEFDSRHSSTPIV
jgi:hypothetical protein